MLDEKKQDMQTKNHDHEVEEEATTIMSGDTLSTTLKQLQMVHPVLILLIGPIEMIGKSWLLNKNKSEMLIGRASISDIVINQRSVSSTHCKITINDNNDIFVEDLNSTNGTSINNKKTYPQKAYLLKDQDQIKVGSVIFKYVKEGGPEVLAHSRNQMDDLTNIYNKSALISNGKEVFQKSKQISLELAIIILDLDNFKIINDTYGHLAGDSLLKEMASLVKNQVIRSEDFFARFGGEEFCVVLCNKNKEEVSRIAERIRHIIESHEFKHEHVVMSVTVSIGVALLEPSTKTWEELFEKADKAVYVSKRSGKNQVSFA